MEVITWNQLGIHKKPVQSFSRLFNLFHHAAFNFRLGLMGGGDVAIKSGFLHLSMQVGLLNVDGFYDTLLTFFDKQMEEEFFDSSSRSIVVSAPTASELLDKLEAHSPTLTKGPKLCWEVERPIGLGLTTTPIAGVGQ